MTLGLTLLALALDLDLPRWVIEVAFAAYVLVVTVFVVLERRRPTATLALLLALVFLPLVGLLAYLLFSRERVRRRERQRERRPIRPVDATHNLANLDQLPVGLTEAQRGLVRLALRTAAAPLRRSERVALLPTAASAHAAFVAAIEAAEQYVHCEFYIWNDDATGRRITRLLTARARAGVRVRVLVDVLGTIGLPTEHFAELLAAGGRVASFGRLRLRLPMRMGGINFRNHRKIMTVDGRVGFVGGLNVGDEYLDPNGIKDRWRDLDAQLEGDAVLGLEAIFLEDWLSATGEVLDLEGEHPEPAAKFDGRRPLPKPRPWRRARHAHAKRRAEEANPFVGMAERPARSEGPLVQVIPSGPDRRVVSVIAAQFSAAIASANRRAFIATPYLVPDEPLLLILRTAALRGVDVRLLVPRPALNDQRLVAMAARSYYEELADAGCRIFEYELGMLHAKYLIVDDVCAIGSANMDIRSFHLNYEVTAMFYDEHVTAQLAEIFEGDLRFAREIGTADLGNTGFFRGLAESFARVLSPLL